jgi:hypothetical protein
MLQEFIYDADDGDVFAETLNSGYKCTDPAYNEPDFYTGIAGFIKLFDHAFIGKTIDFQDHIGRFTRFGKFDLAFYQRIDLVAGIHRGNDQVLEIFGHRPFV